MYFFILEFGEINKVYFSIFSFYLISRLIMIISIAFQSRNIPKNDYENYNRKKDKIKDLKFCLK